MDEPTKEEAEAPAATTDLRTELFENISSQFSIALESDGSLPAAAKSALVELVDSEVPTAAQIISAASISDAEEQDASDE